MAKKNNKWEDLKKAPQKEENTIEEKVVIQEEKPKKTKRTHKALFNVNIRKEPNGDIVGTVGCGNFVQFLEDDGVWAKIGENQYVMMEFFE